MRDIRLDAALAVGALVIGCAAPVDDPAGGSWITARVMQVHPASESGLRADMRCVDQSSHDDTSPIAVVRYRSAHVVHDRALVIPVASVIEVGDDVAVDVQHCLLRPLHDP